MSDTILRAELTVVIINTLMSNFVKILKQIFSLFKNEN